MRVTVIVPRVGKEAESFIQKHIREIKRCAEVEVLYGSVFPVHIEGAGKLVRDSPVHRTWRFILRKFIDADGSYFERKALVRQLKRFSPDVVLAEYGFLGSAVTRECKVLGIPLVVHFHGFDAYDEPTLREYRTKYQAMFEYAVSVIAVSESMVEQLERLGCSKEKILLKPYGVLIPEAADLFSAQEENEVLAVGRFVEKKAPHLTILAFSKALSSFPEARMVMIGDGPLLDSCKILASALGISDSIQFTGRANNAEVLKRMQRASVFVQHSVTAPSGDSEGTPVAVLEASGAGLPVVSTKHAGIRQAVLHGKTGILVDEGDINGMSEALVRLMQSPDLRVSFGSAGRKHMAEHYSIDREEECLAEILRAATAYEAT